MSWWLMEPSFCTKPLSMQTVCTRFSPTTCSLTNWLTLEYFSRNGFGCCPLGRIVCRIISVRQQLNRLLLNCYLQAIQYKPRGVCCVFSWQFQKYLRQFPLLNYLHYCCPHARPQSVKDIDLQTDLLVLIAGCGRQANFAYLWFHIIQFPVLYTPHCMLDSVISNAEIQTLQRCKK